MMMYLMFKWLHIVFVISWMAGLLYLIRLFVYHSEVQNKSQDNHDLLAKMELRNLKIITVPAMVLTWATGITMIISDPSLLHSGKWLHYKILFVLVLSGVTGYAGKLRKNFLNPHYKAPSSKVLRIFNEIPALIMIVIVALVIFKP